MDKTGNLSQRTKKILNMVIDARKDGKLQERERIELFLEKKEKFAKEIKRLEKEKCKYCKEAFEGVCSSHWERKNRLQAKIELLEELKKEVDNQKP